MGKSCRKIYNNSIRYEEKMKSIKHRTITSLCNTSCIIMIWVIVFYSSIIQYKYIEIPHGMLLFGSAILLLYFFANVGEPYSFFDTIAKENICMISFLVYILFTGLLFSPDISSHVSQWITCLQYLFIQIVITSIIKKVGTTTFHSMLFILAIILVIFLLIRPVEYGGASGRYSISEKINPNGLGLCFVAGIWVCFYRQNNTKQPFIFAGIMIAIWGYGILMTGSRKALIGAGIAIFLWLSFCFLPSLKGKDSLRSIFTFLVMFILVIVIGYIFIKWYTNTTISARMNGLFTEATEGKRSNMYLEGYDLLQQNPLFGLGFQSFKYYYGMYSHATLVEIPVSGGIIGTIIYFSAYLISFRRMMHIYKLTKKNDAYNNEHVRIKMVMILWTVMAFYTTCIIHPYQFDSSILFGIIFGETAYIEKKMISIEIRQDQTRIGSRYLKYE